MANSLTILIDSRKRRPYYSLHITKTFLQPTIIMSDDNSERALLKFLDYKQYQFAWIEDFLELWSLSYFDFLNLMLCRAYQNAAGIAILLFLESLY